MLRNVVEMQVTRARYRPRRGFLFCFSFCFTLFVSCTKDDIADDVDNDILTDRTLIVYIAADNDLSEDAWVNISDMQTGFDGTSVNFTPCYIYITF